MQHISTNVAPRDAHLNRITRNLSSLLQPRHVNIKQHFTCVFSALVLSSSCDLMPATHAQETCTRNLCKSSGTRNLHMCRSILYKFFLLQVSCTQLSTALFRNRNCLAHDTNRATWLASELTTESDTVCRCVWGTLVHSWRPVCTDDGDYDGIWLL